MCVNDLQAEAGLEMMRRRRFAQRNVAGTEACRTIGEGGSIAAQSILRDNVDCMSIEGTFWAIKSDHYKKRREKKKRANIDLR